MANSTTARPVALASAPAAESQSGPAGGSAIGPIDVAADRHEVRVAVPGVGTASLPPVDELAFLAGVVTLAATGLMTWPVALTIGAGHLLAHNRHIRLLRSFGEALEEA